MKISLGKDWDGNRIELVKTLTEIAGLPPAKAFKICNDLAEKWANCPEREAEIIVPELFKKR